MIDAARGLEDAWIDPRSWEVHPGYVALLVVADGLVGRPADVRSADAPSPAVDRRLITPPRDA